MIVKEDTKTNTKKVVALLPKTNCGKCGYDNCGKFAKAVAEGDASPFGCRENPVVGHRISEVLGIEVLPQQSNNSYIPRMTIQTGIGHVTQKGKGTQRRGRCGRSKHRWAAAGHGRFKATSLWSRIKNFFGYR